MVLSAVLVAITINVSLVEMESVEITLRPLIAIVEKDFSKLVQVIVLFA